MNITPKHLSSVVKSLSGRTAGEWIDAYVIMEAKILLTTTDMTVQQIAYALNFSSQAFFGKYFRNLTAFTPTAYRAQNR
jgi:AraC-like DNA-binding protein